MSLITRMRKQDAVYWPKTDPDKFGKPGVGVAVAVKVRWEDKHEKFMNAEGDEQISNSVVYVPEVSAGVEMEQGDYLWLGVIGSAPADPVADNAAHEIQKFEKLPDLKAKEFLRTAML